MEVSVFTGFNPVDAHELRILTNLGVSGVIYGLDHEDDDKRGVDPSDRHDRWQPVGHYRDQQTLVDNMQRVLDAGLWVGVHWWGRPADPWDADVNQWVGELSTRVPLTWGIVDAEKHWLKMPADNGLSHDEWVHQVWTPRWCDEPVAEHYAVAVYAWPQPAWNGFVLHDAIDAVVPMAYGPSWQRPGPPILQLTSVQKWTEVMRARGDFLQWQGGHPLLWPGLGAYDQARPGMSEEDAMLAAARACRELGMTRVLYWQLESFDGRSAAAKQRRNAIRRVVEGDL